MESGTGVLRHYDAYRRMEYDFYSCGRSRSSGSTTDSRLYVTYNGSNLTIKRFKCRKPLVHQPKHMGGRADNGFATTSYLLDEGRSQMNRQSVGRRCFLAFKTTGTEEDIQRLDAVSRKSLG